MSKKKNNQKPEHQIVQDLKDSKDYLYEGAKEMFFPKNWEDGDFMDDIRRATLRGAHPIANMLLAFVVAFLVSFIVWANWAVLDEVTNGMGQVIPSGRVQVVQNLEGGIVAEILVKEGDVVNKGETLVRIDDTGFASSYGEKKTRYLSLKAATERLQAEIEGKEKVKFSEELIQDAPSIVAQERVLFASRKQKLNTSLAVWDEQIAQREQELKELQSRARQTKESYEFSKEELELTEPLEEQGVVSKVEVLRLRRQLSDLKGEMEAAQHAVPRAEAALAEAQSRKEEARLKMMAEATQELSEKKEELKRLEDVLKAAKDKVARTTIKAPARSTVKRVMVNTIGGVVQPGMDIVELIPLDDSLLVEARIRPKDIAFIRPGQEASVKITAYDFTVYGALDGHVEQIGADTVQDEQGETFYLIRVRTDKNYLGTSEDPLPIIPGMVASVDILTGQKTVMDYILKPLRKMRESALRER